MRRLCLSLLALCALAGPGPALADPSPWGLPPTCSPLVVHVERGPVVLRGCTSPPGTQLYYGLDGESPQHGTLRYTPAGELEYLPYAQPGGGPVSEHLRLSVNTGWIAFQDSDELDVQITVDHADADPPQADVDGQAGLATPYCYELGVPGEMSYAATDAIAPLSCSSFDGSPVMMLIEHQTGNYGHFTAGFGALAYRSNGVATTGTDAADVVVFGRGTGVSKAIHVVMHRVDYAPSCWVYSVPAVFGGVDRFAAVTNGETEPLTYSCSDWDGEPFTQTVITQPAHGTLDANGYTPDPGYVGYDSAVVQVDDGVQTATFEVPIRVLPPGDLCWKVDLGCVDTEASSHHGGLVGDSPPWTPYVRNDGSPYDLVQRPAPSRFPESAPPTQVPPQRTLPGQTGPDNPADEPAAPSTDDPAAPRTDDPAPDAPDAPADAPASAPPPPSTAAPAPAAPPPVVASTTTYAADGTLRIALRCAAGSCGGSLTVSAAGHQLAKARYAATAGHRAQVVVHLPAQLRTRANVALVVKLSDRHAGRSTFHLVARRHR